MQIPHSDQEKASNRIIAGSGLDDELFSDESADAFNAIIDDCLQHGVRSDLDFDEIDYDLDADESEEERETMFDTLPEMDLIFENEYVM